MVVHKFELGLYHLAELDGTKLKEAVAARRLTLFYFRDMHQAVNTIVVNFNDYTPSDFPVYPYGGSIATKRTFEVMMKELGLVTGRLAYTSNFSPNDITYYNHNLLKVQRYPGHYNTAAHGGYLDEYTANRDLEGMEELEHRLARLNL